MRSVHRAAHIRGAVPAHASCHFVPPLRGLRRGRGPESILWPGNARRACRCGSAGRRPLPTRKVLPSAVATPMRARGGRAGHRAAINIPCALCHPRGHASGGSASPTGGGAPVTSA